MPEGTLLALTTEGIMQLERDVVAELKRRALEQNFAKTEAELVVRDMLPATDLNAATEEWSQSGKIVGGAYTVIYSGRNPENKLFGIYGVCNELPTSRSGPTQTQIAASIQSGGAAIPCTVAIKFGLGAGTAKVKDIWQVQKMYQKPEQSLFADIPVIFNKKEVFQISFYGRACNLSGATDTIILHGKVCEPKGEVIMGAE